MLPYALTAAARTLAITAQMFKGAQGAPVPNVEGDVATLRTADGHMTILKGGQPLRMYLMARYETTANAAATGPVVLAVNGQGRVMLRTPRAGRAFPSQAHPDVLAFVQTGTGAWTPANVTAADFTAGTVTVDKAAGVTKIRAYYTFGDGEIVLKGSRPYGTSGGSAQLFNYPARALHELNQADVSSAPRVSNADLGLPQAFVLSIAVRAASAVYFDGLARHEINIPAMDAPISVSDPVALAALAEMGLKGG